MVLPATNRLGVLCDLDGLYRSVLGRAPAASELTTTFTYFSGGPTVDLSQAALYFLGSVEKRTQEINYYYQNFLNRVPDPSGLNGFLSSFASGSTQEAVMAIILGSSEFLQDVLGSPTLNTTTPSANAPFITALYSVLLKRTPTNDEVNIWIQTIANGATATAIAGAFLYSTEFRTNQTMQYYPQYLNRPGSSPEWTAWASPNGLSLDTIQSGIAGSQEAWNLNTLSAPQLAPGCTINAPANATTGKAMNVSIYAFGGPATSYNLRSSQGDNLTLGAGPLNFSITPQYDGTISFTGSATWSGGTVACTNSPSTTAATIRNYRCALMLGSVSVSSTPFFSPTTSGTQQIYNGLFPSDSAEYQFTNYRVNGAIEFQRKGDPLWYSISNNLRVWTAVVQATSSSEAFETAKGLCGISAYPTDGYFVNDTGFSRGYNIVVENNGNLYYQSGNECIPGDFYFDNITGEGAFEQQATPTVVSGSATFAPCPGTTPSGYSYLNCAVVTSIAPNTCVTGQGNLGP